MLGNCPCIHTLFRYIDQTLAYDESRFQFLPIPQVPTEMEDDSSPRPTSCTGARALMSLLN